MNLWSYVHRSADGTGSPDGRFDRFHIVRSTSNAVRIGVEASSRLASSAPPLPPASNRVALATRHVMCASATRRANAVSSSASVSLSSTDGGGISLLLRLAPDCVHALFAPDVTRLVSLPRVITCVLWCVSARHRTSSRASINDRSAAAMAETSSDADRFNPSSVAMSMPPGEDAQLCPTRSSSSPIAVPRLRFRPRFSCRNLRRYAAATGGPFPASTFAPGKSVIVASTE
mmetsp:Transcript_3376/g.15374  ORF Transcript_3376/g.15374 Transcript_3376/m.15374 type:complete len:231 (-) Transcript_3376:353-1045(-)